MSVLNEVLDANKKYVESFGEKGKLALPPARQFAVLTCMDARLDPGKRYEDWVLDDPAGQGIEPVRVIRDEIKRRVEKLLAELLA